MMCCTIDKHCVYRYVIMRNIYIFASPAYLHLPARQPACLNLHLPAREPACLNLQLPVT